MEQAAIRELHEETGYKAEEILQVSPVIVSDPGTYQAFFGLLSPLKGILTRYDERQYATGCCQCPFRR